MEYKNTFELSYLIPDALLAWKKDLEIEGLMKNFARASLAVEQPNRI